LGDNHNGGTHGTYIHRDRLGATAVARTTPNDPKRRHQADKSARDPMRALMRVAEHAYDFLVFQNDGLFIYTLQKYKASSF
jgi:hypothetical protein